ncbi:MAG: 3-oxoacyl-[acyl-carrier-protein] reductase [Candidatus Latescibacteria bacterium]|jgi:3-oxoacyl-[acyl-carrier protein] reductase|nr:3-oxoacyl-[acyl-carrier-protein] reductase [Candidatus Latescibacterota bacterium]
MPKLKDKTAIVTGASRGIGEAIALRLASEGANVAICASRSTEAAEAVAEKIRASGNQAIVQQTDVSQSESVDTLIKTTLDAWGKIDILINNAGITRDNLLMRMKKDEWDAVLDVNLKGAYHCIKAVTRPMMKARSGRIINISSVVGLMGNAGQINYAASKAGLIGLTKSVAKELAGRNITANVVAPGFIPTEMTAKLTDDLQEKLIAQIPLGKLGSPEDVAAAVAFLASDDAAYMTGQVLVVDGGMVM